MKYITILTAIILTACSTTQQQQIDAFNASPIGKDVQGAAAGAAAAAAAETQKELQNGGKLDSKSIGTAAALGAVNGALAAKTTP